MLKSHAFLCRSRVKGFTLLEMSVVLVIIGVVIGMGTATYLASVEKKAEDITRERIYAVQKALYVYAKGLYRLPCPASLTQAVDTANFGVEAATPGTCTGGTPAANFSTSLVVQGGVPTKTLSLSDDYAFDGWGRRITYTVDKAYTASSAMQALSVSSRPQLYVMRNTTAATLVGNAATYYSTDTMTSGNWVGSYGSTGSVIILGGGTPYTTDTVSLPTGVSMSVSNSPSYTVWGNPTTSTRGLWKTSSMAARVAACWYKTTNFTVNISGLNNQVVSFYMLDWTNVPRVSTVDVQDAGTSASLSSQSVSSYSNGVYVSWLMNGNIKVVFTMNSGSNVALSGIFFDSPTAIGSMPVAYVLMSHGQNGHGAYTRSTASARRNSGSVNTLELENCDCTNAAANGTFNSIFYQSAYSEDSTNVNNTFDDIVEFGTGESLFVDTPL